MTQEPHNNTAAKTQGTQSTAKPPKATKPQGPRSTAKPPEATKPQGSPSQSQVPETQPQELQEPLKQPSYTEIAKRALGRPILTPGKPSKPKRKAQALPESVKLAPKTPKPVKIGLREPIRKTPSELIDLIKDRAINGERLTGLIKAFRVLSAKTLLVYSTTEAAKEELVQNTNWLDAIHASIYTRNYSIVIYRVRRDIPTEEISKRIRE